MARLSALRSHADSPEALAEIEKALRGKSNVVAARAAEVVARAQLERLEPALVAAFEHFHLESDKGCIAKTAIAKALLELQFRAEETLLAGARYAEAAGDVDCLDPPTGGRRVPPSLGGSGRFESGGGGRRSPRDLSHG